MTAVARDAPPPLLELRELRVEAGGRALLDGVGLVVRGGDIVLVAGPNGAGKSTLLRACVGLVRPTRGQVLVCGDPVLDLPARSRAGRVAWLPQRLEADDSLTALELAVTARFRFDEPALVSRREARAALGRLGVEALADRRLGSLSGGERQRVALALPLAQGAPLVLLDEPANHLDPRHALATLEWLAELAAGGLGVVCVTHDPALAARALAGRGARLLGLRDGRARGEHGLDDADLATALGQLFDSPFEALRDAGGRRVIVPAVTPNEEAR
ncbi:MAG: ABC transporter ATP-binding protein [Polyangiaceae bacterium]|nr:ABC transporter ATP-binding protein [Polyangiaceae bacterium]